MPGFAASMLFPYYIRNKVFTVPEFLEMRYSRAARSFFSGLMAVTCIMTKILRRRARAARAFWVECYVGGLSDRGTSSAFLAPATSNKLAGVLCSPCC